jgi:hypothetical protein
MGNFVIPKTTSSPTVPAGGTFGQILAKTNEFDFNTQWINNTDLVGFTLPSLTSGSVLFSDGTTIAQDNANFFFDNTNNRLGIGTNAPAANLQIGNGSTGAINLYIGGAISSDQTIGFNVNGNSVYHNIVSNANTGEFRFNAGAAGGGHYLTFRTGGNTERMRITSTGNIGIGTTTPNTPLEVNGEIRVTQLNTAGSYGRMYNSGGQFIIGANGISNHIGMSNTSNSTYFNQAGFFSSGVQISGSPWYGYVLNLIQGSYTNDDYLRWGTSGKISSAGNLGVGTTTPVANLQVSQLTTGYGTVATNGTITLTGTSTQFTNTFKVGDTITVSGETVRTIATIVSDTSLTVSVAFTTTASALAYTLVGGDRFVVLGNGNVGIGTNVPSYKLHIKGTGGSETSIYYGAQGTTTSDAPSYALLKSDGNLAASLVYWGSGNGFFPNAAQFYTNTGIHFQIAPAGVIAATFRTGGNVLIGTTVDNGGKLQIKAGGAASTDIALKIRNSGDTTDLLTVAGDGSVINNLNTSVSSFVVQRTGFASRSINLMPNGGARFYSFDGEATTTANGDDGAWLFQGRHRRAASSGVASAIRINPFFYQEQFDTISLNTLNLTPNINCLGTATNVTVRGIFYNPTLSSLIGVTSHRAIETVTGDVIFGSTSGNVGIGTTTPISTLDVNGQVSIKNGLNFFKATTNIVGSYNADASNYQDLLIKANSYDFSIGAVNKLFISSAGNVGIGTTTPAYKLDVFGSASSAGGVNSNIGYNITPVVAPAAGMTATPVAGSGLNIGQYYYAITYYNSLGETNAYYGISAVTTAGNQQVNLASIPISTNTTVIGRKIYRGKVGEGSSYGGLIATIANNTATTYSDNIPDSSVPGGIILDRAIYGKPNLSANYISVGGIRSLILDTNLTAFGIGAGNAITNAPNSTFIGYRAGYSVTSGSGNTLVGQTAGYSITGGFQNTIVGDTSGNGITTGSYNIGLGPNVLNSAVAGSFNIAMGYYTMNKGTGSYNILLGGYNWSSGTPTASYCTFIGGTLTNISAATNYQVNINDLITGISSGTKYVNILGNLGIGLTYGTAPTARLEILTPGAAATDFGLRVRNSGNTADLLSVTGNGALTVGGTGSDGTINLARSTNGAVVGAIIQTASITQIHNYQGSGIDFFVTAATNVQRAFVRSTGFGITGTTGGNFVLDASALLQGNSTTQGFLPPRMTNAERLAILTPAVGLMVYCTDVVEGVYVNKSTGWTFIA